MVQLIAQVKLPGVSSYHFNFSPDGEMLACLAEDAVWVFDLASQKLSVLKPSAMPLEVAFLAGHLAITTNRRCVELWKLGAYQKVGTLEGHGNLAISRDGLVASSGEYETIKVWDGTTLQELATFEAEQVRDLVFSVCGWLASCSYNREIKLWDVATGTEVATLEGHLYWVNSLAFSPDGKTLASGSFDETIKLWDMATHSEIATLVGHSSDVLGIAFSPDGRTLASCSKDKCLKLWDVLSHSEVVNLENIEAVRVMFSPSGHLLATMDLSRTLKLWKYQA